MSDIIIHVWIKKKTQIVATFEVSSANDTNIIYNEINEMLKNNNFEDFRPKNCQTPLALKERKKNWFESKSTPGAYAKDGIYLKCPPQNYFIQAVERLFIFL